MAGELYTRTNQKIFYAGLSLDSWRKAEEGRAMNAQALVQAEREATLFHLYGALLGLCHEIAGFYRLPNSSAARAEVLLDRQSLASSPSPELAELVELAESGHTWLGQLLAAHAELFRPPRAPREAKADPGATSLIKAVSVDEVQPPLDRETLEGWRQELKALAQRFRVGLSEW
ncbi:PasA protein [Pseudomonas sp. MM211]|uniref:DUF6586 family protein n=1 Tax=Pseudomonas sp. MM211 TaxID=2866808 RepID=UPI001CECDF13|nr:DUF6586 family protein [Pseudomonas sp. MM211]UCJ16112.1 PasA protein [Pseudomonas sp. MM211]